MEAIKFDSQKIEQLLNSATSERQRKMYQSLLEKARIEEKKARIKEQIQKKALSEAEALKAKISSNIKQQENDSTTEIEAQLSLNLEQETHSKMTAEKVIESKKTKQYREYTVKQHQRKIYERVYKFVCSGCDKIVERTSFALCCPSLGMECGGKRSKCRRYKK